MRPIELIPESIDVTNNGPEPLHLPFSVVIAPGATKTILLSKYAGGPSTGAGTNTAGTSTDPAALDPQVPVGTVVGSADPAPAPGIAIGAGAPRSSANQSGANAGPVHINGDSPRQRLWNAIVAAALDGTATGQFVSAVAIGAGGTGYSTNDVLTVVGGTKSVAATITVVTQVAGVVTAVAVTIGGAYSVQPSNPVATSGGTGTGCTLNLTFAANIISLANQVVGVGQPNVPAGGGSFFGADMDYQTPWQKRAKGVDTGLRTVDGAVKFNAAPRGGAAVVGIIPR